MLVSSLVLCNYKDNYLTWCVLLSCFNLLVRFNEIKDTTLPSEFHGSRFRLRELFLLYLLPCCSCTCFRRSPVSVAAAAIYLASQASADKKSQKGILFLLLFFNELLFSSMILNTIHPALGPSVHPPVGHSPLQILKYL